MPAPIEVINHATETANAVAELNNSFSVYLDSLGNLLPKIGYTLTIVAAFFPKPGEDAPYIVKLAYKITQHVAFNVKHAENAADKVKNEHRQLT